MKNPTNRVSFRVRYAETDAMGIVHHSRYIPWMELGRTEFLRQYGFSYRQCEEEGYLFPLLAVACQYHAPAKYDDLVTVETTLKAIRPPYLEFSYRITREPDGLLLVTGETKQICITKDKKPRREPVKKMEEFFRHLN
ncbi:MAG: acyl-CoA thioesterase [Firmicutes bacterium]|nr:acyl-CoA thioesterase [Bacillota bacterium]